MKKSYDFDASSKQQMLKEVSAAFDKAAETRAYCFQIETRGKGSRRSNPQNAYLFGVVYQSIAKLIMHHNQQHVTPQELHEDWAKVQFSWLFSDVSEEVSMNGYPLFRKVSTSQMDSETFWMFVTCIRDWCRDSWGLDIPEPSREERFEIDEFIKEQNQKKR